MYTQICLRSVIRVLEQWAVLIRIDSEEDKQHEAKPPSGWAAILINGDGAVTMSILGDVLAHGHG